MVIEFLNVEPTLYFQLKTGVHAEILQKIEFLFLIFNLKVLTLILKNISVTISSKLVF